MPKTQMVKHFVKKFFANCKGFDLVLKKVNVISASNGKCLVSLIVSEEHTNSRGLLHGGMSATLIDSITGLVLLTQDNWNKHNNVSVTINNLYLKPAVIGDEILIEANVLKAGKAISFTNVEIRNKHTGDVLVKGEHVQYMKKSTD